MLTTVALVFLISEYPPRYAEMNSTKPTVPTIITQVEDVCPQPLFKNHRYDCLFICKFYYYSIENVGEMWKRQHSTALVSSLLGYLLS